MVTYGVASIFPAYDKNSKKRYELTVTEAIESVIKKPIQRGKKFIQLGVTGNDDKGLDCMLPDIKYEV
jgi:hypothetical protein